MGQGRWCRICDRQRPNEAFSGRGHRDCICRDCQKLPRSERDNADATRDLFDYVEQSHISAKNLRRLAELAGHEDPKIREHAAALLEMAALYPGKRERWARLAASHPDLLRRYLEAIGASEEADARDVCGHKAVEILRAGEGLAAADVPVDTDDEPDIPF